MLYLAIGVFLFGVGFIIYDKKKNSGKWEKIIVAYSEVVGNKIVENDKQYIGLVNAIDDLFKVKMLKLLMPVPPVYTFIPTKGGNKKLYLIKIDSNRYGFRVPSMDNEIFVQERDEYGNLVKTSKDQPKIKKLRWKFCDDVVEPDVKHWEENIMEKLKLKHRTKAEMWSKWIAPIVVGLILVAGLVSIQLVTKYSGEQLKEMRTMSTENAETIKESTGLMNNLIKKVEKKVDGGGG